MSNKATIEIDADAGTVNVTLPIENRDVWPPQIMKAELVAVILAIQSKKLMVMTTQELMVRYHQIVEEAAQRIIEG